MKSMRSSFALLFTSLGAALLFANCTVKSVEDDGSDTACAKNQTRHCACTNGDDGAQACNSKGTGYGECKCDGSITVGGSSSNTTNNNEAGDGNNTSTGGKGGTSSTTGGTSAGGAEPVAEGGAGGADPFANIDPEDCASCLAQLCPTEWTACNNDAQCLSEDPQTGEPLGEYADIQNGCIEPERLNGVVKRDVVRGCGVSVGQSTDPAFNQDWAPVQMAPTTVALMNCMAMGEHPNTANGKPDASWANDPDNFPIVNDMVVPTPWPEGTCAKLACTSKIQ
jgi:hypothetical protein